MADPPPQTPPRLPPPSPSSQSQILSLIHHLTSSFHPQSPPPPPPPPSPPSPSPPPPQTPSQYPPLFSVKHRPPIRITSEFNSDTSCFFHKVSSKVFDGVARLKFSFQNNGRGQITNPQLALLSNFLTINYDIGTHNAILQGMFGVGNLFLTAAHNVKAPQGELTMMANLSEPGYKLVLASSVPPVDPPKATLKFPCGEVSLQEKRDDKENKILSVSGITIGPILHRGCTALYKDGNLNIRYSYKDEEMSFIPCISLPSNAVSFAFKRYFGPVDKLSYWYNFDNKYWSTVYKHRVSKDCKFKAGYDSKARLGWASFWIGNEREKLKMAPMKLKMQFMVEVPQDDVNSSALMFRVKKRWDI